MTIKISLIRSSAHFGSANSFRLRFLFPLFLRLRRIVFPVLEGGGEVGFGLGFFAHEKITIGIAGAAVKYLASSSRFSFNQLANLTIRTLKADLV